MYQQVLAAAKRLAGVARRTPVLTSTLLNEHTGRQLYLKCENFQRAGAFKFRGAYNAVSALPDELRQRGVVTYSSGNHAQAVALAARLFGVPAAVVMPADSPPVKRDAVKGYGGVVVAYDRFTESREAVAAPWIEQHGYTFISPFDHEDVIFGQATAAEELFDETGPLDYLVVPCSGGGLLAGSAVAARRLSPSCKVIGVEPAAVNKAQRSFRSKTVCSVLETPTTIADGLSGPTIGKVTLPLILEYVDDVLTVSESEILSTVYFLWSRLKIVVEPAGAVGLAAVFHKKLPAGGQKVGAILSGGNADLKKLGALFARLPD